MTSTGAARGLARRDKLITSAVFDDGAAICRRLGAAPGPLPRASWIMPKRFHLTRLTRRFRAVRGEARDMLHGGPPTARAAAAGRAGHPVRRARAAGARPVHAGRGGAPVQRRGRGGHLGDDDAVGRGVRAAHGRRRHHLHLDHHVLPSGKDRRTGDVDAARALPHHGSDPAGVGDPHRRSGRARGMGSGCRCRVGRGGRAPPPLPALGGHRRVGRAGRGGGVAARRVAGDLVDRLRGHRVHRPRRPAARPLGGRAVLPADGRRVSWPPSPRSGCSRSARCRRGPSRRW